MRVQKTDRWNATQRALRIDRQASGNFVVLLWTIDDSEALLRVVRQGSLVVLGLGTCDFDGDRLNAVRWAARHYAADVVYVVSSRNETDDNMTCRKYTRRKGVAPRKEGTVSEPDSRRPR